MQKLDRAQFIPLMKAQNYREFLSACLAKTAKGNYGTQAHISRKAGFASRSYLSEVITGRKGLSRDAMLRLKLALDLPSPLAQMFETLVFLSHPQLQMEPLKASELEKQLNLIRRQIRTEGFRGAIAKPFLKQPEVFQVYAALGTETRGASLAEIKFRTRLPESFIQTALKLLIDGGAVRSKLTRYFAITDKADLFASENAEEVAAMVRQVCGNIQKNSQQIVSEPGNLNVYSAFSIRRSQIPKFKKRLREALEKVMDEFQDDSGESIQQVFISSFRKPLER